MSDQSTGAGLASKARDSSVSSYAHLDSPVDQILSKIDFEHDHTFIEGACPDLSVIDWPDVNRILHQQTPEYPRFRLTMDGRNIPPDDYTVTSRTNRGFIVNRVDPARLTHHIKAGATVVISAIDELHQPIEDLAIRLENRLRARVSANGYIVFGHHQGFELHWDDHDALILQTHGRKRWEIFGMTRQSPMYRDIESNPEPKGPPIAEYTMVPGDVLYLSRGCWHTALPTGEPTMHLTYGFSRASGVDLLQWMVDQMRADELFRRSLPSNVGHDAISTALRGRVEEFWTADVVTRFFADRDLRAAVRPRVSLPWEALDGQLPTSDDFSVRLVSPRAQVHDCSDSPTVVFRINNKELLVARRARPILDLLLDGQAHPFRSLSSGSDLGPDKVRVLLRELFLAGIAVIEVVE